MEQLKIDMEELKTNFKILQETRRIMKTERLEAKTQFAEMKAQFAEMKDQVQFLQGQMTLIQPRDKISSGGNIEGHLKEVKEDKSRSLDGVSKWEEPFQKSYGINFQDIEPLIEKTPRCVWTVLNLHAHVVRMGHWEEKDEDKKVAIKDEAVRIWKLWASDMVHDDDRERMVEDGHVFRASIERLKALFETYDQF